MFIAFPLQASPKLGMQDTWKREKPRRLQLNLKPELFPVTSTGEVWGLDFPQF